MSLSLIDKLTFTTKAIDLDYLRSVTKPGRRISRARFYPDSHCYMVDGAIPIYVRKNRDHISVDFNPNHFGNFTKAKEFLERLLYRNLNEPRLKKLHLNLDLTGISTEDFLRYLNVAMLRKIQRCKVLEVTKDFGSLEAHLDMAATYYIGSVERRRYVIYDRKARLGLKGTPVTRVELQLNCRSLLTHLNLENLPEGIMAMKPFLPMTLKVPKKEAKDETKPAQWIKRRLFELLEQKNGFLKAKKEIRQHVPKYLRKSSFGRIINDRKTQKLNLDELFQSNAREFFKLPFREVDTT